MQWSYFPETLLKTGDLKNWQKYIKDFWLKNNQKWFYSFTCMLSEFMGHDSNKELEKISNLKKWQPVFFWGVKTYFGILPLKWCNFRHEKKGFNVIGFDPIKI